MSSTCARCFLLLLFPLIIRGKGTLTRGQVSLVRCELMESCPLMWYPLMGSVSHYNWRFLCMGGPNIYKGSAYGRHVGVSLIPPPPPSYSTLMRGVTPCRRCPLFLCQVVISTVIPFQEESPRGKYPSP